MSDSSSINQHTAILLINTGSPAALTPSEVRKYLIRFLTDSRIIGLAPPLRHLLVRGLIAPLRAKSSIKKYQRIWSDEGPLLRVYSHRLSQKMEALSGITVRCAMRYERDSVRTALAELHALGKTEVILLPLFPHYAISSFETAVIHVRDIAQRAGLFSMSLRCVKPYYGHPEYVEAFARSLSAHVRAGDHVVFSFHGIPLYQVDPYVDQPLYDYPWQCTEMTRLALAHPLLSSIGGVTHEICYQSRFGHHKWLSPATIDRVKSLPSEGYKRIVVVCPSFVCDCLESVDEIGYEAEEDFRHAGGDVLDFVPCLNDDDATAQALLSIAKTCTLPLSELLPPGL
ncbi:ferrochelatase [Porphyromonas sp.]|uniref:ferrochelatase n=1 Tax=Porphyromonas sp. TaxID=1924944 RepID=UPI0026DD9ECC|nr:ferrochelatase [Porphyromonas sp.]MDO4771204.1 ferrochelatase [Porphyromonas sp.]